MRVLHICLANFYIDNHSYQENMITKYHKLLGLEVEIIASLVSFDTDGKPCELEKNSTYYNEHGIKVTRLNYNKQLLSRRLRTYRNTYEEISKANPDIIFIHGCQFLDIKHVARYAKGNPNVKVYVDNHADFNNSGKNFLSKNILHKIIWRKCAEIIEPHTEKFYGVLPARVEFLTDVYRVPKRKVELLEMGVDDEIVEELEKSNNAFKLKQKHKISDKDFVIITGGKIDSNKIETFKLMEAVNKIQVSNVKLLVFGSVIPEYKEKFKSLLSDKVNYVGWIKSTDIYEYLDLADLVVFPGLHSVLWEQAVGLGKPCVFKYIEGFTHVDTGGNCLFLYDNSTEEILELLKSIIFDDSKYRTLMLNAKSEGKEKFSYRKIAKRSIDFERGVK